ncbi:hypothetical protein [Asanoa siamensis]|nr:hypothetical protein [Asanoa siamensis]
MTRRKHLDRAQWLARTMGRSRYEPDWAAVRAGAAELHPGS